MFQYAGGDGGPAGAGRERTATSSTIDPIVAKLLADVRSTTCAGHGDDDDRPAHADLRLAAADQEHDDVPDGPRSTTTSRRTTACPCRAPRTTSCRTRTRPTARSAIFPGFPVHGLQDSDRYSCQCSLRSVLDQEHGERGPRRRRPAARRCFSPNLAADMFSSIGARQHERLRDHLEQLQEHQQPVPELDATARARARRW